MRTFSQLVFDDWVFGTTPVYTANGYSKMLAHADQLHLHAVAGGVSGTTSLTVRIEMSSDDRTYSTKNATAEIPATSLSTTAVNSLFGNDPGTTPSAGFVRLNVALTGTSPVCHLKIYATGRVVG